MGEEQRQVCTQAHHLKESCMNICCPFCKGTGKLEFDKKVVVSLIAKNERVKIAKRLRKANLSIREIADVMGFKNPGSITHLLK